MSPQDAEQARWFAEEVQPHESSLRGYLRSKFESLGATEVTIRAVRGIGFRLVVDSEPAGPAGPSEGKP